MPSSLLPNQPRLIQVADLGRLGASSDFLAIFQPRPLLVQIVLGGVLGTMTWQWQLQGDSAWSGTINSEAITPWSSSPVDPAYAVLTFAAGTYVLGDTYVVSSTGVVTGGSGTGIGLLSATRFDPRADACDEVTSLGVTWMQPRVVPPVLSIGPQIAGWFFDLVKYRLRSRQGMTPAGAGAGDDNDRARAIDAEKNLKMIGASEDRPPDIVDSSQGDIGAGFNAYPQGDDLIGW